MIHSKNRDVTKHFGSIYLSRMRLFRYIWIACCACCVQAQTPAMLHFDVEDGLPGNVVYCAAQDRQGYIWFGTDKGLSRFDGQAFFNYGTEDGLPDPEVLNLHEDVAGRLWIACFKQKPVYRLGGQFVTEKEDTLLNRLTMKNAGYVFTETADNTLWIASGGVFSLKNGFQRQYALKNIDAIIEMQGRILGLNGSGVFHLSGLQEPQQTASEAIFTHRKWAGSYTRNGNRLLFAFPDMTLLVEYRNGRIVELERLPAIFQTVYTDRMGRFWGASPGKGVVCFENDRQDLSRPAWYLPGKKISGIYHDFQGNFWFLSTGEGVFLRPHAEAWHWDKPTGLPSSNVLSLQMTHDGTLLAGDDLGNVHRFSAGRLVGTRAFGSSDGNNFVRQMLPVGHNSFWVVGDDGFLDERHASGPRLWAYAQGTLSAGAPKAMAAAGNVLWFGSSQGIASWDPVRQKMPRLVKKGRVTAMAFDTEQQLWAGGIEGLYSSYQNFAYNWGDRFEVLKQRIVALSPGGEHLLWAVTPQAGLLKLHVAGAQVRQVEILNTPVKDIKKVFPAPDNSVWLATNKGVFCMLPGGEMTPITTGQGLAGNEVNDLLVWHDTLWAATTNGLSLLDLKTIRSSPQIVADISHARYQLGDSTVLLDFANGARSGKHGVVLGSGARQFSAWYTGLKANPGDIRAYRHIQRVGLLPFPWFTFPNLFRAMLHTPDTIWLTKPNYDFGHKLEAGRYLIRTTLVSFDGVESMQDAELNLTALPHWTETIWVWLAAMTVVFIVLIRFYRMRMRYLRAEARMFQLKHQALKAQINPHFVGNSINAIQKFFYPPDPEKASEYIHLFTVLLRKTLVLSEQDFCSPEEEIAYTRGYLEMIQLRYGHQFRYRIEGADTIDPQMAFPAMMLQPLVENATQHGLAQSGPSELVLRFWHEGAYCYCSVRDNGPGIHVSQARKQAHRSHKKSFGIRLLQEKAQMLNQLYPLELEIHWTDLSETMEGNGTSVQIRFKPFNYPTGDVYL